MKLITFKDITALGIAPQTTNEWALDAIKSKHTAILPPKMSLKPSEGAFCNFMPCIVQDEAGKRWGGMKLVTRYPGREPALRSQILLFDAENGDMLAFMDGDWITAMRTGAVAAHSIGLFAPENFATLGVMGLGNIAYATMLSTLPLIGERAVEVKLLRYKGQEDAFIERFQGYGNLTFTCFDDVFDVVKGSEVVVSAVTYAGHDLCPDEAFDEGVLVVPVHTRGFGNCDLFFDKVFADDRGHVEGFKYFDRFKSFAEVSDVVEGRVPGRESERERILAYNVGIGLHDIFFAAKVYQAMDTDALPDIDLEQPLGKYWV